MENNNGALAFDVLIRDSNIEAMLAKDEQRITEFKENVEEGSNDIVQSFANIGKAVAGLAITSMLKSWISDIISVRGEFQQTEIAFTTMLGSAERATSLMQQLTTTAAVTPFDMQSITQGAKQLLAYGESAENVNDTLVRLGNIASGLSIPLNDLTMLYGTTMVQGRLFTQDVRQFMGRGIPLVQELAKQLGKTETEINNMVTAGQIGFPEVQKVIESLTSEGGMFFGLMEEQSKSLTGQMSNLEDAWDMMLNDIGKSTEGILSGGISVVASLIENYEKCLKVMAAIAAVYGTYKVAVIASALAQGNSTRITLLDNIALKARIALAHSMTQGEKMMVAQKGMLTAAQKEYIATLQQALTVEQQEQILRNVRSQAIQAELTEQQALYLSRMQLTAGTVEYIAAAEAILTADQREALAKQNLTRTGTAYALAIEEQVRAQQANTTAQINALRTEAALLKQKQANLLQEYRTSKNKIEQTRVQIALAQQEGNTEAVAMLKEQQHNQLKQHAIIISDLKAARTQKEAATQKIATLATQQASVAGKAKAASDTMQTATSGMLSTATTFLTGKLKALWATMLANPITAIITAATTLISIFMMFGDKEEEATDAMSQLNAACNEGYGKMNLYFGILKTATQGTKEYEDALENINNMCREYGVSVLDVNAGINEQIQKHDELIEAMERATAAQILKKRAEEEYNAMLTKQSALLDDLKKKAGEAKHTEHHSEDNWYGHVEYNSQEDSENIRAADEALWANLQTAAMQGAEKLRKLEGEEYDKALKELVAKIKERMQAATHATDEEVMGMHNVLHKFVKNTVELMNGYTNGMDNARQQLKDFTNGTEDESLAEKFDLASMSLEELHKKVAELEGANVTVDFKALGYESLMAMIAAVKGEIETKQNDLNTENGINEEVKRLKDLRAQAKLGSDEWKNYNNQINALTAKLPKTGNAAQSAAQKLASAQQAIAQKRVELEAEVQESIANIERDGYKKRQLEAEAQHQKELARIRKERTELEEKYKTTKKPMPTDVAGMFDTLIANENARYQMEVNDLVATEIDERKKQYTQYYKWVEAYGAEVANRQYSALVAEGNTYEEWLKGKIAALVAKEQQQAGGLDEKDGNALIAYQEQLRAVQGVKTEMEKFTESLTKAKENSKTLGDYLTTLAAKKLELQQGKGGLIGEDRTKAITEIDKQITETTEQLQKQLLETYKTNAELRLETETKYEQEITWLRQHGYEAQAQVAEKARKKAIAEIDATRIQATDKWKDLFANAQYLSGGAFDAVIADLRKQVEAIGDVDIKRQLSDQLDGLEKQVLGSKNPFKLLVNSIKAYEKAADGTPEKSKKFAQMFESIAGSIDFVKQGFDSVVNGLKELGLAGDEATQEMLGDISNMIGGAGQLAKGIASMNPMDMIQGGISLITSAISLFDSTSRRIKREMEQHEKQLKALQRAYSQISWEVGNAVGDDYYTQQKKAIENLQKQKKEYEELARLEQSKKSKDRDDDKVNEYLSNAEQAARDIADIEKEMAESLTQTNFKDLANDLADTWAEAFGNMEDSAESFDEVWNQTIANAVKNSLKLKLIEPIVNDFTNALADYMGAHNNSVVGFDFAKWKGMLQNAGDAFTEGLKGFEEYFQDLSDEAEDAAETLEGQVKGVTEDTASIIAGEMTTMRIRQMEMLLVQQNYHSCMQSVENSVKQALTYLSSISTNTAATNTALKGIASQLESLKNTVTSDPLRAKGLTS